MNARLQLSAKQHPMQVFILSSDLMTSSRLANPPADVAPFTACMSSSALLDKVVAAADRQTVVLIDLATAGLEIAALVAQLRAMEPSPAAIIAFGPHVQEARLQAARDAGCDAVLTRGQVSRDLDEILAQLESEE